MGCEQIMKTRAGRLGCLLTRSDMSVSQSREKEDHSEISELWGIHTANLYTVEGPNPYSNQ